MEKFWFADGQDICLFDGEKVTKFPSKFIEKYKANAESVERAKSWKHSGEGAQFRGDVRPEDGGEGIHSFISGIFPCADEDGVIYSFTVNQTSGIYKKLLNDEKAEEIHIINSLDTEYGAGCLDAASGTLAVSIKRNNYNSDIAVFDTAGGDYKTVTEGDTLDDEPFISPDDKNVIYFTSRGAGRDMNGAFAGFSPAAVCKLDLNALDVTEIKSSDKFNYYKPILHNGKLYAIKAPLKEKGPNPFVEILLIPFRIIQALANFVNAFVRAFTGKSLASGGNNPAKGRKFDSREEFVKGNLINVEKQLKKNKKRGEDYGFIPLSWQLVEVESGEVIKSGVADYDITEDGTFIVTNGKHIFAVKDKKSKKLCSADCCLRVACRHFSKGGDSLF